MRRRLRGWLDLPGSERWTLMLMLVWLPLISISLSVFGYVRTRSWIERLSPVPAPRGATADDLESAERLAQLAVIAGRHGAVTVTCLRQALLVFGWLRRRGLAPELTLGVRKLDAQFDAHAWVELRGFALGQADLDYAPLKKRRRLR